VVFQGIYNTGNLEFKKNYQIFPCMAKSSSNPCKQWSINIHLGHRPDGPDLPFRRVPGMWHD